MTAAELPRAYETPLGFCENILHLPKAYDWQARAVMPLHRAGFDSRGIQRPTVQLSVLAPNEAGKSSWIVSGSACYWATCKGKHGKVAITTADQKQLNEQIIPALEKQIYKMAGWQSVRSPYYRVRDKENRTKIIAYVTDDAGRVEGLHGSPDAPLLEIVDEAKNVKEPIYTGIDRCSYQAIILCSSGGLMQGTFYNSQTKDRANWICVNAGLKDCPHISKEKIDRIVNKYGENDPFTRSCIYGEFMQQDENTKFCVTHASLFKCLENPPRHLPGLRVGFVDFADGSAEYVLAIRDGNKTEIALAFRESNKRTACARLIHAFVQNGLKQEDIWGDAADKEACDHLAAMGWTINRKNFGAKAKQEEVYQSWSAEAWLETGIAISKGELIVPRDDILIAQLTTRQWEFVGRGKKAVEDKSEMRKRGIESPDRADAFCACQNIYPIMQSGRFWQQERWSDQQAKPIPFEEELRQIGAYAG